MSTKVKLWRVSYEHWGTRRTDFVEAPSRTLASLSWAADKRKPGMINIKIWRVPDKKIKTKPRTTTAQKG